MSEYKIFTKDELEFIIKVLEKHGCCSYGSSGDIDECPFWSWDEKNTNGELGECTRKHSEQFCVMLRAVLENDELILAVRDRKPEDIEYEREEENKKVLTKVKNVKDKINNLKVQENDLFSNMHKLKTKR